MPEDEEEEFYMPPPQWRPEGGTEDAPVVLQGQSRVEMDALDLCLHIFEGKTLPEVSEEFKSILSEDRDGIVYQSPEISMPLTPDEVRRVVLRNLQPEEYKALKKKYGIFYEIHEAFYRPGTGEAIQPKL